MTLDIATAAQPTPDIRGGFLDVLTRDREWVAAQFTAIMTASGFGDRVIVGTLPGPRPESGRRTRDGDPRWPATDRPPATGASARVRSPPGR